MNFYDRFSIGTLRNFVRYSSEYNERGSENGEKEELIARLNEYDEKIESDGYKYCNNYDIARISWRKGFNEYGKKVKDLRRELERDYREKIYGPGVLDEPLETFSDPDTHEEELNESVGPGFFLILEDFSVVLARKNFY